MKWLDTLLMTYQPDLVRMMYFVCACVLYSRWPTFTTFWETAIAVVSFTFFSVMTLAYKVEKK